MNYLLIKQLHMVLALVSVCGFVLRWQWQVRSHPLSRHPLTRVAPHVVDTLLLLLGVALVWLSGLLPWQVPWLAAKLTGLLVYILLGMAAMSVTSRTGKIAAFGFALITFTWMVSVALTKHPMGFLSAGMGM